MISGHNERFIARVASENGRWKYAYNLNHLARKASLDEALLIEICVGFRQFGSERKSKLLDYATVHGGIAVAFENVCDELEVFTSHVFLSF